MNELDKKEIQEYLKTLPQKVRNFLADPVWSLRVGEIAKKYSLSPEQEVSLENEVLVILAGLNTGEDFNEIVKNELIISSILSTQIVEDLNVRVFEYALKMTEEKVERTGLEIAAGVGFPSPSPTSLEIPPVTLPAIEPGQTAHTTPAFSVPPKPITSTVASPRVDTTSPTTSGNTIHHLTYTPAEPLVPVSKPIAATSPISASVIPPTTPSNPSKISVPRYIAPADDEATTPANAIPHNLPGEEVTPIEKKYVADPYREPIQ